MKNSFNSTSSNWVRYDNYEWKHFKSGQLYLTPSENSKPAIYNPLEDFEKLVVDSLNVGKFCMSRFSMEETQSKILEFARTYGLLGLMTALPTTTNFMEYEAVYIPKNNFIKAEVMETYEYLNLFFPFEKPDFVKNGIESMWNIEGDKEILTLAMVMRQKPMAVNMSFQREYAESFDFLKQQFVNWYFTFTASFLYYEDFDDIDDDTKNLYRQSMSAFDGIAPTYHIELLDKPTIVWDFHSLALCVQMMFSFMLADEKRPLRICQHCNAVFLANRQDTIFCNAKCKNRFNVYKSRSKK